MERCTARDAGRAERSYSGTAIQTCLMLHTAFKLALRQAEDLMMSVAELLGCELAVPDHTTVSRRAMKLPSIARAALPEGRRCMW
ncbi:MAG: transposase [Burkholderiales bacterium]|nr:transposase [Burkholderiales bacterium]